MERKVCFILEVGNLEWGGGEDGVVVRMGWGGRGRLSKGQISLVTIRGQELL